MSQNYDTPHLIMLQIPWNLRMQVLVVHRLFVHHKAESTLTHHPWVPTVGHQTSPTTQHIHVLLHWCVKSCLKEYMKLIQKYEVRLMSFPVTAQDWSDDISLHETIAHTTKAHPFHSHTANWPILSQVRTVCTDWHKIVLPLEAF